MVMEEVVAAADNLAAEEQKPLHVEINNDEDEECTVVRVVAPDRAQLLTDLTSALSGLGLSIERASISTVGRQAINAFHLQEKSEDGPKKVLGKQRLESIEQRLRLQFRRRAMQKLLKVTNAIDRQVVPATPKVSRRRADSGDGGAAVYGFVSPAVVAAVAMEAPAPAVAPSEARGPRALLGRRLSGEGAPAPSRRCLLWPHERPLPAPGNDDLPEARRALVDGWRPFGALAPSPQARAQVLPSRCVCGWATCPAAGERRGERVAAPHGDLRALRRDLPQRRPAAERQQREQRQLRGAEPAGVADARAADRGGRGEQPVPRRRGGRRRIDPRAAPRARQRALGVCAPRRAPPRADLARGRHRRRGGRPPLPGGAGAAAQQDALAVGEAPGGRVADDHSLRIARVARPSSPREALTRPAARLAAILFSPLDPKELLALCRRATEVESRPRSSRAPSPRAWRAAVLAAAAPAAPAASEQRVVRRRAGGGVDGDSAATLARLPTADTLLHDAFALILRAMSCSRWRTRAPSAPRRRRRRRRR